jgi:tetratricopeptide (TPR) repeat protein
MNYVRAIFTIGQGVDLREAARALDRVLALVPDHAGANEEKGGYLFRAGRRDEARPFLEKARANDPSRLQARVLLGVMVQDAGDLAQAAALFEEARQIEPGDRWLAQRLLALYEKQGDAAKRSELERVMAQLDAAHVEDPGVATKWLAPSER